MEDQPQRPAMTDAIPIVSGLLAVGAAVLLVGAIIGAIKAVDGLDAFNEGGDQVSTFLIFLGGSASVAGIPALIGLVLIAVSSVGVEQRQPVVVATGALLALVGFTTAGGAVAVLTHSESWGPFDDRLPTFLGYLGETVIAAAGVYLASQLRTQALNE